MQCKNTSTSTRKNDSPDTVTTIINNYDTTVLKVPVYVPVPSDIIYFPVPGDIDTAEILNIFFAKYFYQDTAINDTNALIIVFDTITQNRIINRRINYTNRRPTQIITNTIINSPAKLWNIGAGGFVGGNKTEFEAGASIIVTTNKKASYTASYDFINKTGRIGLFWNIR